MRIDYYKTSPGAVKVMLILEDFINKCGLEKSLLELVKLRASQINWTQAVTLLSETHAPEDLYQNVLKHFNEKETVDLTLAIITINGWNRLAVSFRKLPT